MNSYNNLARWTLPTTASEKAFYAKHAPTIDRYGFSLKVIQAIWICFSINPTTKLLWDNLARLPYFQAFAPIFAIALLGFMHYILHNEIIETLSNWKDNDETTINGAMNWVIPVILLVGLGLLDVKGVTLTLRSDGFDGQKATNSTEAKAMLADARSDYNLALANVANNRREDSAAALAPFQKQLQVAQRMVTNDDQDIRAKSSKVAAINADWRIALGKVRQKASDDTRTAEAAFNAEKNRINGKSDSTHTSISQADAEDKNKAEANGWWITVFFMLTFVFMAYKYVILRVDSGIRRNMQFTELDAQGGFLEKLTVVLGNIWQRQGHRFLTFLHEKGSKGAAELTDFDGNVILKAANYNGGGNVIAPTGNTPPPTGGGENGGGNNRPTPPSAPPTGGNAKAAPIVTQPDIAVAERRNLKFSEMSGDDQFAMCEDIHKSSNTKASHLLRAFHQINPSVKYYEGNGFLPIDADWIKIVGKCVDFASEDMQAESVQSPMDAPTPSVAANETSTVIVPQSEKKNGVAHQIPSVPHQKGQIVYSELDNTLNLLRGKLQKESESQFNNGKADKESVRNRIVKILDEAGRALSMKSAKCDNTVLRSFSKVAADKLALMKKYECEGFSEELELWHIIDGRLDNKEVDND